LLCQEHDAEECAKNALSAGWRGTIGLSLLRHVIKIVSPNRSEPIQRVAQDWPLYGTSKVNSTAEWVEVMIFRLFAVCDIQQAHFANPCRAFCRNPSPRYSSTDETSIILWFSYLSILLFPYSWRRYLIRRQLVPLPSPNGLRCPPQTDGISPRKPPIRVS